MNIYVPILVRPALRYNGGGVCRSRFATYKNRTSKSHPTRSPKSICGRRRSENNTAEISGGANDEFKNRLPTRVYGRRRVYWLTDGFQSISTDFPGYRKLRVTVFARCGSKRDAHVSGKPCVTPVAVTSVVYTLVEYGYGPVDWRVGSRSTVRDRVRWEIKRF